MSKYHDISSYAELEKALANVSTKIAKKENRIGSDFRKLKSEATPLNFVSGMLGSGVLSFNSLLFAWKTFKVLRRAFRRK